MSYLEETMKALRELRDSPRAEGGRSLVAVSSLKSNAAWHLARQFAEQFDLAVESVGLIDEDGQEHATRFVAHLYGEIDDALALVYDANDGVISREVLQRKLGAMFGYSQESIDEFVESETGLSCVCALCGGPETAKPPNNVITVDSFGAAYLPGHDHDERAMTARRTQPWS